MTAPVSIAAAVVDRMQERWAQVQPDDLDGSWGQQVPGAVQILAAGQILAATQADARVTSTVGRSDLRVNAPGFAGRAADGRSLTTLLDEPVIAVKTAIGAGQALDEALGRGLVRLTMAAATEVTDAGRLATGAAITARPQVHGYVRVVNAPACGRCIVLAGRVYRWSDGFQRHPRCDCQMVPVADAGAKPPQSPRELFDAMDSSEQEKAFTVAGAKAIRDGADLSQVVNAQRGMYEAGGRSFTTEGTTRRGQFGRQAEARVAELQKRAGQRVRSVTTVRLTPRQIYREAGDDRAEAIRLLRRFGYLTG